MKARRPQAKIIAFAKGAGLLLKTYRQQTGADAIGLDWSVPLSFAAELQTDEQLQQHARNTGGTVFHPTSTCKMRSDPMAVVDPELRVHGIGSLRVVDASIMPTVVSGNTNAATIMIGEKAADLIRQPMRMAA